MIDKVTRVIDSHCNESAYEQYFVRHPDESKT